MRNVKKLGLFSVVSCFTVGLLIAISTSSNSLKFNETHAGTNDYTLVLSKDNGQLSGAYSISVTSNSNAVSQDGNKIEIMHTYCGTFSGANENIYAQIKKNDGYFYNNDVTNTKDKIYPLTNITSITAVFSGTAPTLYLGTSKNPSSNSQTLVSGTKVNVSGKNFFKVSAGNGVCYLESLTITYACGTGSSESILEGISISDSVSSYLIGSTYNSNNGLIVTGNYNTGDELITTGYTINGTGFNPNSAFTTAGTYSLNVTFNSITSNTIQITVTASGSSGSSGTYRIQFKTSATSDSGTVLTDTTISNQVTNGTQYIASFSNVAKIFEGNGGLKLGSSSAAGGFTINLSSTGKVKAKEIVVATKKYSSDTVSMSINGSASQSISNSSYTELKYTLADDTQTLENIAVTTNGKRCYVSYIDVNYGEPETITMTNFSLNTSSLLVSLGGSETLTTSVSPTNVYPSPTITWSSNKTSVATVNNGVVSGISVGTATITATATQGSVILTSTCAVTVSTIAVSGVTLNATSGSIYVGKTMELQAIVSPFNATNKTVSWSSNSTNIATVNNGVVTGVSVGTTKINATTADGGYVATCNVTVEATPQSAWTIMIYMCGADLESDSQYRLATGDLQEIQNVTGQPDNVNVIVQAGGANSWSSKYSSVINASKLNRFHIENGTYVKDVQLPRANMGLSSTFQSFMEWGLEEYPAERTMVIFWNHGGAMRGNCYDEQFSDDSLLNSEVNSALSAAFTSTGRTQKLEAVGYDVCLAQVQDIAEFNSNYFNYMIASQESEAGYGWDYDGGWLDLIYKNPTTVQTSTVLTSIVDTFIDDNGGVNYSKNDQTLSWLDLSKMAAYKTAWENMANYLNTNILTSSNKAAFQTLIAGCKHFADDDYTYFGTFDAKDFLTKLSANSTFNKLSLSSYISAAQSALSDLIGYSSCGKAAGNANGLCMFFSISSNCYKSTYYKASETNFINWRQINNSFGA